MFARIPANGIIPASPEIPVSKCRKNSLTHRKKDDYMKRLSFLTATCILTLVLSTATFGGDMPGPGAPAPKPPAAPTMPSCEPLEPQTDGGTTVSPCEEATPDLTTDAIIIALQFVISMY